MSPTNKPTRIFRMERLDAKIANDEYCCMWGYLELCRARGERPRDMAKTVGLHRYTIYYHYRKLAAGDYSCPGRGACLRPVIEELWAEKKGPVESPIKAP